jgi:hypothetical protein
MIFYSTGVNWNTYNSSILLLLENNLYALLLLERSGMKVHCEREWKEETRIANRRRMSV